ncbi:MAG TPA: hypothetical protein VEI02_00410 [Planctomycetota bacterium]|nr:hypothetical protein [Planctomycetota bacterium]
MSGRAAAGRGARRRTASVWGLAFLTAVAASTSGCGDAVQLAPPPQRTPATGGLPPGHPPTTSPRPMSQPATPIDPHGSVGAPDPFAEEGGPKVETPAADPSAVVLGGEIRLDPAIRLPSKFVLFVSALTPGVRMPVLVKRYETPTFPLKFELTGKDNMGGAALVGPFQVRASLSETGDVVNARHRTTTTSTHAVGATDVVLTLAP